MALPVVVFLLALSSLADAVASDCKDIVKPFMPEDPQQVNDFLAVSLFILAHNVHLLKGTP